MKEIMFHCGGRGFGARETDIAVIFIVELTGGFLPECGDFRCYCVDNPDPGNRFG